MHDCARAPQTIRHDAKKYNIDPKRVGSTGGSAGAGISEWLAFHDNMADSKSKDPILRQSTRLSCISVVGAQTSYDPRFLQKLFNTDQVEDALILFFGMKSAKDVDDPKFHPLFEEASPINHASSDDPPSQLIYKQENHSVEPNSSGKIYIHHPKFGETLKKKMDALGVECVVKYREEYGDSKDFAKKSTEDTVDFLLKGLGVVRKQEEKSSGDTTPTR